MRLIISVDHRNKSAILFLAYCVKNKLKNIKKVIDFILKSSIIISVRELNKQSKF